MASSGDGKEENCYPGQKLIGDPGVSEYKPYPVQQKIDPSDPLYEQYAKYKDEQRAAVQKEKDDSSKFDIKKATQYGNFERVKKLLDEGADVNKFDDDGVSLLHWAAINNRLDIASLYIERGAEVNKFGGVMNSTPLHWATRQGHRDMVVFLMKHNADPLAVDGEGYQGLHLASMFSHSSIVAYFIAKGIDVDTPDKNGMTALMWASYRTAGLDPCRLLLTMGADTSRRDQLSGNQPIHWAAMAGNHAAVNIFINRPEIDMQALNSQGQSPLDIAKSRKNRWIVNRLTDALRDRGLDIQASFLQRRTSDNRKFRLYSMIGYPFLVLFAIGWIFEMDYSWLRWWGRLILVVCLYGTYKIFKQYLTDERLGNIVPFGIYMATKVWMYFTWFFYVLPYIESPITHLLFFINTALLTYHFYYCVQKDPGFIKPSRQSQLEAILKLAETQEIELERFCSTCIIHKPLRSKHCSVCDRCVAKFDHHCPWVYNCVGAENVRHFVLYLTFLIGMICWCLYGCLTYWRYGCLYEIPYNGVISTIKICVTCSPWVTWIFLNSSVHLVFVGILLMNMLYQSVYMGVTTNEKINLFRYSHFKTEDGKFHNPYSRGYIQNLSSELDVNFCGLIKKYNVDWRTTFKNPLLHKSSNIV